MILLVLMLAPFSFSTSAFVFAGLLEPMASDLGVPVAAAGQLQTAFALSCAVGGPVMAGATARFPRKGLLVAVLCVLAVGNALCALAGDLRLLLALRMVEGFAGALTLPLASAIAVAGVPEARRGAALATVFGGIALAFLVGIPAGSLVGGLYGWPASFWLASGIAAMAALLVALLVPRRGAAMPPAGRALRAVLRWPLTGLLSLTFLAFTATFTTVAYIGPIITRLTGLTGGGSGRSRCASASAASSDLPSERGSRAGADPSCPRSSSPPSSRRRSIPLAFWRASAGRPRSSSWRWRRRAARRPSSRPRR